MSTDGLSSLGRFTDIPEAPTGLFVIAILGQYSALFGFFSWFATIGAPDVSTVVAVGMMGLAVGQAVTMLALIQLRPWAWYASVLLYSISTVVHLFQANNPEAVLALIVALYIAVHKGPFEP